MAKKKHKQDKKLHNFDEKLHNSLHNYDLTSHEELELNWRDAADLPEDENEMDSEIYYFTDEDGNVQSREFLTDELIPYDDRDSKDLLKRKPRHEKAERLKPGTVDIVGLSGSRPQPPQQEISLPVPEPGARPIDVRISSEVVPDVPIFTHSRRLNVEEKQVIIHLSDNTAANEPLSTAQKQKADVIKRSFTLEELDAYVAYRCEGLAKKSVDWINRASQALWKSTSGEISHETMTGFRTFVLEKYKSADSHSKVLGFTIGFLNFLAQRNVDPSYLSFQLFLEKPRTKKIRKALTERIVTRDEIGVLLQKITDAQEVGADSSRMRNYRAFTLLAAHTGLRPSTMQRLTVGQFRAALKEKKPVLHVLAQQEKNRIEHYVPLHPSVVTAISDVLGHDFSEKNDAKPLFLFNSFEKWLERQKIPLSRVRDSRKAHLWLSDFRKFAEQFGDVIGWESTNRKYVLAHGMTGVDWEHYKHPLPEDVYDVYMQYWRDIKLTSNDMKK